MAIGDATHGIVNNAVGILHHPHVLVGVISATHLTLSDLSTRWSIHVRHLRLWSHSVVVLWLLHLLVDDGWTTKLRLWQGIRFRSSSMKPWMPSSATLTPILAKSSLASDPGRPPAMTGPRVQSYPRIILSATRASFDGRGFGVTGMAVMCGGQTCLRVSNRSDLLTRLATIELQLVFLNLSLLACVLLVVLRVESLPRILHTCMMVRRNSSSTESDLMTPTVHHETTAFLSAMRTRLISSSVCLSRSSASLRRLFLRSSRILWR